MGDAQGRGKRDHQARALYFAGEVRACPQQGWGVSIFLCQKASCQRSGLKLGGRAGIRAPLHVLRIAAGQAERHQ